MLEIITTAMQKNLFLATFLLVVLVQAGSASQPAAWEEDFRRCLIAQPIDDGRVVIEIDEERLAMDVQRGKDEDETSTYVITFDNHPPINIYSQKNPAGGYPHVLGTYRSIAPVLSKARTMTISVTASDKHNDVITVAVGNGGKAMAFLKKCDDYWRRYKGTDNQQECCGRSTAGYPHNLWPT
jgi:hypothetical protein